MDFGLFFILGFVAISALVKTSNLSNRLAQLEVRFSELERRFAGIPFAAAPGAAPAPEPPAPADAAAPIQGVPEQFREPQSTPEPVMARDAQPAEAVPPGGAPPDGTIPPSAPPPTTPSLEERFGTRWVVWIGGVALALGGFFLVRQAGSGVLAVLCTLLAAALVGAGEWLRRKEKLSGSFGLPSANIPSILTAAGTSVAYATVWASYELWGFLSPGVAFVLLGAVAIATLAAALLHGPWVASLGLVGGYLTPLLVSTQTPNFWVLYVYLAVVSGAAFTLARMRLWRWLAFTAVAFGLVWMLYRIDGLQSDLLGSHAFFVIVEFALVTALIVSGLFYGPDAEPGKIDWVSSTSVAVYVVAACLFVLATRHVPLTLTVFTLLTAATLAIAWKTDSVAAAVPAAAVCAIIVIARWAFDADMHRMIAPAGTAGVGSPQPDYGNPNTHIGLGTFYGLLFAVAGFLAQGRSISARVPILWSASGVLAPVLILISLYAGITDYERSMPFAIAALVLAALFSWATEQLNKQAPRPGVPASTALFATGAVAALALAFTFALDKGWLSVALALMVPGIAWIAEKRPLPMLRWLAAVLVIIVVARTGWEPRIVGDEIGTTPIFNWLLYGYGVPAAAFWLGGWLLRRRADDRPARIVDSGAILFTILAAFLEIRHYINDGDIYGNRGGLAEVALHVCVGLAMALGLEHVRERTRSVVHNFGALLVAAMTLFAVVFGLFIGVNPVVTGEPVGGPVINLILLGYGLPAVLAITLALKTRGHRGKGYRVTAAVGAVALALTYITLQVTRFYHGSVLTVGPVTNAEKYTYSVVWLAFGVVLLIVGIFLRSQPARLASAAIVTLTIAKVFLLDMSDLTGVLRALSFIGLGLVLVCIGLLYQRLLFPRRATMPSAPPST